MALKETITHWHEGVTAYQEGRYKDAVRHFENIEDASARIYFNTACAYLRLNKVEAAFMSLNETVKKDPHLAIGHFSRGIQQVKLRRFEGAINDFENAIQKLRGNRFINYQQLGMEYKLHLEDIAIAKASALYSNGQSREAIEVLVGASQRVEDDETKKKLVDALHRVQSNGQGRGRIKSLSEEDWYHGTLSRDEAENQLHYDGDFLIRQSKNRKTGAIQYVLSVYWQGYRHILCVQDDEDQWKFEGRSFPTISGLIRHQMKTKSVVTKRSRAELITPIGKHVDSNNPLDLIEIPSFCIFHPPKEFIANLQKRNYVAKAKVISSTNPENTETLEIPEIRTSYRSSSGSNDRLSITSSTSGSDGYLTPKPSRPPPQLPSSKDNDSTKSRLDVKDERRRNRSGESRSRSRGRDQSADDTLSRRAPPQLPSERNHDVSDDRSRSNRKAKQGKGRRDQRREKSADDTLSRRALPPLPTEVNNFSRSTDDLLTETPAVKGRKGRHSLDDDLVDYVNVPKLVLPPKNNVNVTVEGKRPVSDRIQRNVGKGIENELTNVLNARFKKKDTSPEVPRPRNSAGVEAPRRPPPPRR